ncbi:MAG: methyltransferase domain-containing protein [Saprospiraceae bacterium]|nr:methyltransferase domain-containing protein [Saprospiraceae bacterium]
MQEPLFHKEEIPYFLEKTAVESEKDLFDQSEEMVLNQTALHLADEAWGSYPAQSVLDYFKAQVPSNPPSNMVEVGCGVGRMIGELAEDYPSAEAWGIDYSHQLLKRAKQLWVDGKTMHLDLSGKGLNSKLLLGKALNNLKFGLGKAEQLPFGDASQDLVMSSFLLDRLEEPEIALHEMFRVTKQGGQMMLVSPLNFRKPKLWQALYPPGKIRAILMQMGFSILDWEENFMLFEPLDGRGNGILWKCLALTCQKS